MLHTISLSGVRVYLDVILPVPTPAARVPSRVRQRPHLSTLVVPRPAQNNQSRQRHTCPVVHVWIRVLAFMCVFLHRHRSVDVAEECARGRRRPRSGLPEEFHDPCMHIRAVSLRLHRKFHMARAGEFLQGLFPCLFDGPQGDSPWRERRIFNPLARRESSASCARNSILQEFEHAVLEAGGQRCRCRRPLDIAARDRQGRSRRGGHGRLRMPADLR